MARRNNYGRMEWRNDDHSIHLYFGAEVATHLGHRGTKNFKIRLAPGVDDDGTTCVVVERDEGQDGRLLTASYYGTVSGVNRWTVSTVMRPLGLEAVHDCVRREVEVVLEDGEYRRSVAVYLPESVREVGTQVPDQEEDSPDLSDLTRQIGAAVDEHGLEGVTRVVLSELNMAAFARSKRFNADGGKLRLLDLPTGVEFEG